LDGLKMKNDVQSYRHTKCIPHKTLFIFINTPFSDGAETPFKRQVSRGLRTFSGRDEKK